MPARGASTGLFLGGENAWRPGRPPRPVAGLLSNGLSPLLPPGHAAEADQLAPVPGGVVAHISDTSTDVLYGALGRVVFIPTANAPARVIARATMIAVSPDGQQVWVQTAVQPMRNGVGVPAGFTSPTWAVDLTGRRVSPVLHLPLGLRRRHRIRAADAESGHRAGAAVERRDRPAGTDEPARRRQFRRGRP